MAREEYYRDPDAPQANSLAPSAIAIVRDTLGRVLLVQRVDSGNWELPGGRVELGESATIAAEREVAEESGVTIKEVVDVDGVYSDPGYVIAYPATGEVRQQFAICFHALPVEGAPRPDHDETCEAAFIEPERMAMLPMHPIMRARVDHALSTVRPHID